jgi:hypothetical protein
MKEIYEFRVLEEFAPLLFEADEGKRLGDTIRKIEIATDDPRYLTIGRLQAEIGAKTDRLFFSSWNLRRRYSKAELEAATLFELQVTSIFEPAGEECGTKYDETTACPLCGAGAKQITPLYLPERRIPKSKDFSRTIANEILVSRRVAELFARHAITGFVLLPVRYNRVSSAESQDWFQLIVNNSGAEVIAPTRIGINPFDEDEKGEYRCSQGDLIGLNLLSEVFIKSASLGNEDIIRTRQYVGVRGGVIRPERIILVSAKLRRLIEYEKLKGYEVEVAHLA